MKLELFCRQGLLQSRVVAIIAASIVFTAATAAIAKTKATVEISSPSQDFKLRVLTDKLQTPWGLEFLPDGRMLVTEREGGVHIFNPANKKLQQIKGIPKAENIGQGGMLDVAIHPMFSSNRWVYLSYTKKLAEDRYATTLARGTLNGATLSDVEELFQAKPVLDTALHFGSALIFDNDGLLRMTVGDRHTRHEAQKLESHLGKTLRLTDAGKPAPGNPFLDKANALPEIYSYGHRNPQGISINRLDGKVWISEHGPRGGDEVNFLEPGLNYGWPVITYGEEYKGGKIGEGTHKTGMQQPLHYYVPSIGSAAIEFYDAGELSGWTNSLFVAGMRSESVSRIRLNGNKVLFEERLLENAGYRIREIRQGRDGLLYLLADQGVILQIAP